MRKEGFIPPIPPPQVPTAKLQRVTHVAMWHVIVIVQISPPTVRHGYQYKYNDTILDATNGLPISKLHKVQWHSRSTLAWSWGVNVGGKVCTTMASNSTNLTTFLQGRGKWLNFYVESIFMSTYRKKILEWRMVSTLDGLWWVRPRSEFHEAEVLR